ncbi:hypothetical protein [Cognatishimia activa]|uniref:hypothetical protein n=1 Tax=Cognatishimia activa TaxID=1715691 RepID=UPI0006F15D3C|nr:hypothetical protein [Cognatishimia activa]CUI60024.1 MSP1 EGF domain 1 [Cognatishimia activa]
MNHENNILSDEIGTYDPFLEGLRSLAKQVVCGFLLGMALLLFGANIAHSNPTDIPKNASAKSYGDGWKCDLGYRIAGEICVAITVPENAYATNRRYGLGWECLHGFLRVERASCVPVIVPEGGYLGPSGSRWFCHRGFQKIGNTCEKIKLPPHAYLTNSGVGAPWKCDRGFEEIGDACVAISVPDNAFLNNSGYGQPWSCHRGFFEENGACTKVFVPENAYFDEATYGNGWKCERGFSETGNKCIAIELPPNAHLDRSGNQWECNKNFYRSKSQCVLRN